MSTQLDLDDVAATSPLAARQLADLRAEVEDWRKLLDPVNLYVNLLQGKPAQLTKWQLAHLLGQDYTALLAEVEALRESLSYAEAALADIGDADREPGDDIAWCESRAAKALPRVRAAIAARKGEGNT